MWRCCAARVTHYLPIYQFHCPDITSTAVSDHACTQNKVALLEVTRIPDPNRQKQSNTESGKFQAGAHQSIMYVAYCIQSQGCLQCLFAFSQLYVVRTDVVNKSADIEHKSAEVPALWLESFLNYINSELHGCASSKPDRTTGTAAIAITSAATPRALKLNDKKARNNHNKSF